MREDQAEKKREDPEFREYGIIEMSYEALDRYVLQPVKAQLGWVSLDEEEDDDDDDVSWNRTGAPTPQLESQLEGAPPQLES